MIYKTRLIKVRKGRKQKKRKIGRKERKENEKRGMRKKVKNYSPLWTRSHT